MLLKQSDRARTVGTAANAGTTRCYICSWCDISLPELPICSFPANKMDVIVASTTIAGEFQEFVRPSIQNVNEMSSFLNLQSLRIKPQREQAGWSGA